MSNKPRIITRTARRGEKLTTLDKVERTLDESTVLVCDSRGALSIAGVMGGAESEVSAKTRSILLEGAAWNFINIRRTARAQDLPSEASYRFSRGVHPALAERGVRRGLELMQMWAGGEIAPGLVDNYPLPPKAPQIEITPADVKRWLGIELTMREISEILERLEFHCTLKTENCLLVTAPDHRLDIGEGMRGKADVIEEIARIYGYENIPETRMSDQLPPQIGNPTLDKEERVRDLLVVQGLQEIVSYRFTTPEREARLLPETSEISADFGSLEGYVRLANPIAPDKAFLRRSVLASVLETAERNARLRERLGLFEIGPAFIADKGGGLPAEPLCLALFLAGPRAGRGWQAADTSPMDFYDLKGVLAALLEGLHIPEIRYEPQTHPTFHPGKCARIASGDKPLGVFGELHPQVRGNYDWPAAYKDVSLLAADLDLDALLALIPSRRETALIPEYPAVLEDLALVVDEALPAGRVAEIIRAAAGKIVAEVRLFDVYRGEAIPSGKKSLAYSLTYQAADKTLSDRDVAGIRARIVKRLEQELGASLRS